MTAAVKLADAAVTLGGNAIWSDASLEIATGEYVAVLGPNGSGKSTLLRVLLGLLPLSHGTVSVLGRSPTQAKREIGYLPQRHAFDASTRIRGIDLVRLGLDGHRFGLPRPGRSVEQRRVDEAIDLVGATSYARRAIGECSGGEQQRLLIAEALVAKPRMLFLDEPLDSLDLPNQTAVAALLEQICRSEQITILLVAHDVNPLLAHLDRVVYIAGGKVLSGRPEQVIASDTLSDLYQSPIEVLRTSDGRLVVVGQPDAPAHHSDRHAHP
ncbi:MAG TPA: ATP-binding cassette domain-containing protein [Gaiellaceae bacterium]|jgi:zinc/manganese transport system ATP-binding protein